MALYAHVTLADLRAALVSKLGDNIFWTTAEIDLYIAEAMRYWGAITHRWKKRESITLTQNVHWYDLYSASANLNPSITDQGLLVEIQYHLLEAINSSGWSGSSQFTLAAVESAMQGALDEFYFAVSPKLNVETVAGAGMVDFHDLSAISALTPVIDIHRAAWLDVNGDYTGLWRSDEDEMRHYNPSWSTTQEDKPQAYSLANSQPLEVRLMPRSNQPGSVQYVFQKSAPVLDLAVGVELGIPNDLAWVIKYGTLAELLDQEGVGTDGNRAKYCRRRFTEGLEIARTYPSVVAAAINGVPLQIGRTLDMDGYNGGWQNEASGTPTRLFFSNYNLFAVAPSPDAGPTSVLFDIVSPAIVPTVSTDAVQLDKQEIEAIITYAQHIASFKQGGVEFMDTAGQMSDVVRLAEMKNGQLRTQAWAKEARDSKTWDELVMRPVK